MKVAEYVYVAAGRFAVKVGSTSNVDKRFAQLRRDGAERVCMTWHRPHDASIVEATALDILFNGVRPHGPGSEWFSIEPDEAIRAVEQAIAIIDAGAARPPRAKRRGLFEGMEPLVLALARLNREYSAEEIQADIERMQSEQAKWAAFEASWQPNPGIIQ
jgi:hypothetical protein